MTSPIRLRLEELYAKHGTITPELVVKDARDEDSPLHAHFTWDADEALEKHLLVEARQLIQRYKLTIITPGDKRVKVRRFVNVAEQSYAPVEVAMRKKQSRTFVMEQALKELNALRLKYEALIDFDTVIQEDIKRRRKVA
jgi:hypothetical protein